MIKVLIIDDEKGICGLIEDTFKRKGYTVLSATDPFQAIPLVEKERPQVVILDIVMDKMDGLTLLERIKAQDKNIKVVMLTFLEDSEVEEKARKLGAEAFLTKPFSTEELEEAVDKIIRELLGFTKKEKHDE